MLSLSLGPRMLKLFLLPPDICNYFRLAANLDLRTFYFEARGCLSNHLLREEQIIVILITIEINRKVIYDWGFRSYLRLHELELSKSFVRCLLKSLKVFNAKLK